MTLGSSRIVLRRAFGDLDAVVHHDDVVGDFHHHAHVVLDQQDRSALIDRGSRAGVRSRPRFRARSGPRPARRGRAATAGCTSRGRFRGAAGRHRADCPAASSARSTSPMRSSQSPRQIDRGPLGVAPGRGADQAEERQPGGAHQRVVLRHHQVLQRRHAGKQPDVLERARDPGEFGPIRKSFSRSSWIVPPSSWVSRHGARPSACRSP